MKKVININEFYYNEKLIRAKDIGKIFVGVVQSTVDGWVKSGLINRYKLNGSVFYKLSEIDKMIENAKE